MRGQVPGQPSMYALVSPDAYVPKLHPIREVKQVADACLRALEPEFAAMYAHTGRHSVPPERLLKREEAAGDARIRAMMFEFDRTASRLTEMQTRSYLELPRTVDAAA